MGIIILTNQVPALKHFIQIRYSAYSIIEKGKHYCSLCRLNEQAGNRATKEKHGYAYRVLLMTSRKYTGLCLCDYKLRLLRVQIIDIKSWVTRPKRGCSWQDNSDALGTQI